MIAHSTPGTPFSLGFGDTVDRLLGLGTLQRMYRTLEPGNFVRRALQLLDVQVTATAGQHVPSEGGAIVVANHPTGALDGLVLLSALLERRDDVKVLGNHLLTRIPEMREWTIPVDPYRSGAARTVGGLRAARRWVEQGGLLAIFPAGAVARHRDRDEPWHDGVLALARWTGAPVVPTHVSGAPSAWFRLLGRVHPAIATALLPRELLRQRGASVRVTHGAPVSASRITELPAGAALPYLRARVHGLESCRPAARRMAPLAPAIVPSMVEDEIAALPPEARMADARQFQVFCARADQIPRTLREIGRLRERTFRDAGEGTGRALDLDRYDSRYLHLFLWDTSRREVAGAYRLGLVDGPGHPPVYTESLFRWSRSPGVVLGPSIELGRSFIRVEHQRDPAALMLLWKGIGAFLARNPRYRRMFGPVSISADYTRISRELIAEWLVRHRAAECAADVQPSRALAIRQDVRALVASGCVGAFGELDALVREIEATRSTPVLLRQYLRLNGRVMAVSRDPGFNDALDALVVVEVLGMPAAHLERYCGAAGAHRIRAYAGAAEAPAFGAPGSSQVA